MILPSMNTNTEYTIVILSGISSLFYVSINVFFYFKYLRGLENRNVVFALM